MAKGKRLRRKPSIIGRRPFPRWTGKTRISPVHRGFGPRLASTSLASTVLPAPLVGGKGAPSTAAPAEDAKILPVHTLSTISRHRGHGLLMKSPSHSNGSDPQMSAQAHQRTMNVLNHFAPVVAMLASMGCTAIPNSKPFEHRNASAEAEGIGEPLASQYGANVVALGAVGDGTADDTAAFKRALAADQGLVWVPPGRYRVTDTLRIPAGTTVVGAGRASVVQFENVTTGIVLGGHARLESGQSLKEIAIEGHGGTAVLVENAQLVAVARVAVAGQWTDGFAFRTTFGSSFTDLSTAGAKISHACFVAGGVYNANYARSWYTSNLNAEYNIVVDGTGGSSRSHGNVFDMITAQGGDIGLYVGAHSNSAITGLYTENVGQSIRLGNRRLGARSEAISIRGGSLGSTYASHRMYGKQEAIIEVDNAAGVSLEGLGFPGAYGAAAWAPVRIVGDGSGARAVSRVTPGGQVHSIEVLSQGKGYSHAAATVGGKGEGALANPVIQNGTIVGINVGAAGRNYSPGGYSPVVLRYSFAVRVRLTGFYFSDGFVHGIGSPMYPWVVRSTEADPSSGVSVEEFEVWGGSTRALSVVKGRTAYEHVLQGYESQDSGNARYLPPVYP